MGILNYTTTIDSAKTIVEVQSALARRGVTRISTLYDEDGHAVGLGFSMCTEFGPREFELPVRTEGVLRAMTADKTVPRTKCTLEQAERVAWRIAKDWLAAQSALIDADLASLDEVMMPYMIADSGKTVYELYRSNQLALEGGGGK